MLDNHRGNPTCPYIDEKWKYTWVSHGNILANNANKEKREVISINSWQVRYARRGGRRTSLTTTWLRKKQLQYESKWKSEIEEGREHDICTYLSIDDSMWNHVGTCYRRSFYFNMIIWLAPCTPTRQTMTWTQCQKLSWMEERNIGDNWIKGSRERRQEYEPTLSGVRENTRKSDKRLCLVLPLKFQMRICF